MIYMNIGSGGQDRYHREACREQRKDILEKGWEPLTCSMVCCGWCAREKGEGREETAGDWGQIMTNPKKSTRKFQKMRSQQKFGGSKTLLDLYFRKTSSCRIESRG